MGKPKGRLSRTPFKCLNGLNVGFVEPKSIQKMKKKCLNLDIIMLCNLFLFSLCFFLKSSLYSQKVGRNE